MNRFVRLVTLLAIALAASIGSGAPALGQDDGGRGDLRFVVVSHGQASDPFWSVVQNGVNQAAEDMGVQVEYQAPETFDMVEMAQLIDAAVASQPDGLVVSLPDADALGPSIEAAVAADIPVITMNSGSDTFADLGVLLHVGQTEFEAGMLGEIAFATFDLSPEVLEAIDAGDMLFAIDQAQYLQGYLPIVFLTKYLETGALPLGSKDRVLLTGPQIVTAETASQV